MSEAKPRTRLFFWSFILALWIAVFFLGWMVTGRAAGLVKAWRAHVAAIEKAGPVLEDSINQEDPILGWKHVPGKRVAMDRFFPGEGIVFRINNQGFRANQDYSPRKPAGTYRIQAVGDSFTFGNVNFEQTWTVLLAAKHPALEVINMGASAYGLDQMYLWFREDGVEIESDLVIVALIQNDFNRVFMHKWLSGHGRPRFVIRGGELVLTNVPVPPRVKPGETNAHPYDLVEFLEHWYGLTARRDLDAPDYLPFVILSKFHELVSSLDRRFLVVYLPVDSEVSQRFRNEWQRSLAKYCSEHGIDHINLRRFFRKRADGDEELFRQDGHYSPAGNAIAAAGIFEALEDRHLLR